MESINPNKPPSRDQMRELDFTRVERAGLFLKDVLLGQFRPQWSSTSAAIERSGQLTTIGYVNITESDTALSSDSIVAGL